MLGHLLLSKEDGRGSGPRAALLYIGSPEVRGSYSLAVDAKGSTIVARN